jgi:hypothetical protein
MAFATYVLGDKWFLDQFVDQMILLWANALGISDGRTPFARPASGGRPVLFVTGASSDEAGLDQGEQAGRRVVCVGAELIRTGDGAAEQGGLKEIALQQRAEGLGRPQGVPDLRRAGSPASGRSSG